MHIEFLVEDSSGRALLEIIIPKLFENIDNNRTWRIHSYKGIGRIPKDLRGGVASNRILLDQLPRILKGYGRTPGIHAVVVVLDSDRNDCVKFLRQLEDLRDGCDPKPNVMFRIAIEEMEAWYFGDVPAVRRAFPKVKVAILDHYIQDSVCGTWEMFADAVHLGGSIAVKKAGWPLPGQLKHQWAEAIGPHMDVENNVSPSFGKLRDGVRRL